MAQVESPVMGRLLSCQKGIVVLQCSQTVRWNQKKIVVCACEWKSRKAKRES